MIEDTVTRQYASGLYSVRNIKFFKRTPHAFVDRVRRDVHDAGDFLGIFVLENMAQRFNLRGRKETDIIVRVTLHAAGNRASGVEIKLGW